MSGVSIGVGTVQVSVCTGVGRGICTGVSM